MINYPVDVVETRWCLWSVAGNSVVLTNGRWPVVDGGEIQGLDSDLIPLLMVQTAKPVFDPATQKVVRGAPLVDAGENTITTTWTVLPLSQEELDANAEKAANDAELEQIKAVYLALKNGTGTSGERLVRVERVLAFMLKRDYKP